MTDDDNPHVGFVRALIEHGARLAAELHPQHLERANANATDWLERFEADARDLLGPLLTMVANDGRVDPKVRDALGVLIAPEHQTQVAVVVGAAYALVRSFVEAAIAPEVQQVSNVAWSHNTSIPLAPPEIALGVLRHNPHIADPYGEAADSGIARDRLDALIYNTGEPPALSELLLLYRRGQITEDRLRQGTAQSRIRDEWFPEVLDLRYAPPSGALAVAAAVQNHLSIAEATTKWAESGLNPADFGWAYETHGRPPGTEQMLHLLNRGLVTEDQVREAVRESDIKNKYIDAILATRVYLPPPRSIVPMLRSGSITETYARELLAEHGVRAQDIDAFIGEAHTTRTETVRNLGAAQVIRAYEQSLITRPVAVTRLLALRYVQADVDLMLELADNARTETFHNAAIARVHNRYVTYKIADAEANAELGHLKVAAGAITQMLTLWGDERAANVSVLSVAQIQQGYHRGIIALDAFIARMHQHGYHGVDVKILAAEAWPPGRVPQQVMDLDPAAL